MLHTGLITPISELLERHRKQRPDKVAYWDAARSVTYSQLASRTASIAAGLSG
jgi:acyl-CoA synthetase (AMP-forming)/AMP-acid ligase II